jgi:hypothetical protein
LAAKKGRVLEQSFRTHYSVDVSLDDAVLGIREKVDASIGNYWDVKCFLNFFDDGPVA